MEAGTKQTFVIFNNTNHKWLRKILRKGFQHTYILHWNGYCWLLIDKNFTGLDIKVLDRWNGQDIAFNTDIVKLLCEEEPQITVLSVSQEDIRQSYCVGEETYSRFIYSLSAAIPKFNHCLTTVINFLGLMDVTGIYTPYSLYKHLIEEPNTEVTQRGIYT